MDPERFSLSITNGVDEEEDIMNFQMSQTQEEAYLALKMKRKKCSVEGCTIYSIPTARSYHQ